MTSGPCRVHRDLETSIDDAKEPIITLKAETESLGLLELGGATGQFSCDLKASAISKFFYTIRIWRHSDVAMSLKRRASRAGRVGAPHLYAAKTEPCSDAAMIRSDVAMKRSGVATLFDEATSPRRRQQPHDRLSQKQRPLAMECICWLDGE